MRKAVTVSDPNFPIDVLLSSVFRVLNISRKPKTISSTEWQYVQVKVVKKSEDIFFSNFVHFEVSSFPATTLTSLKFQI
jgi:hypothetical protein